MRLKKFVIKKQFILAFAVILLLFLLSGCGGVKDTLSSIKERFAGDSTQEPTIETSGKTESESSLENIPIDERVQETMDVVLYFSDLSGQNLVASQRTIPKETGIARRTIQELIKGPGPSSELLPTIPQGTSLLDINVRPDGLCIVDFSEELVKNHRGGSTAENLTVYSIVNTLTQFPTVDRVQLLVEGRYIDTIAGHLQVSEPLYPQQYLLLEGGNPSK